MKPPLYYTFCDHAHWVDLQWSWGEGALEDAVGDLLALVETTGAAGNLDCDGAGLERLASDSPEQLDRLRSAVQAGRIELVGGTYAQPNGGFHGGESNLRQRVYGARTCLRLFGVRPRVFATQEFDWFPQLPQVLKLCGFQGAALYFPWLVGTPHVPREERTLIQWEGLDGTRLPAVARTALAATQWPDEYGVLFGPGLSDAVAHVTDPAIVQWLQLVPSEDWNCRASEVAPAVRALLADERYDVRPVTLSGLLEALDVSDAPVRAYTPDDCFHGASLGKNGDFMPRYSRMAEEQLLAAESVSALCGLFGRPYAGWDVYPTWELEEAWRELLIGQHHHVHAHEGRCGDVGERSFERSLGLSSAVFSRSLEYLAGRVDVLEGASVVYNPLGWTRDVAHQQGVVRDVPAFGYKAIDPYDIDEPRLGRIEMSVDGDIVRLVRGRFEVTIQRSTGLVTQLTSPEFPDGLLAPDRPIGGLEMLLGGEVDGFEIVSFGGDGVEEAEFAEFMFLREGRGGSKLRVTYSMSPLVDALWIRFAAEHLVRPDPGTSAALRTRVRPAIDGFELLVDHPLGLGPIAADHDRVRAWPAAAGESPPHVVEDLRRPFTASSLVDLIEPGGERGALIVHDGSQAFSREDDGVGIVLCASDPWDGDPWDPIFEGELWVMPHGRMTQAERARVSLECNLGSPRFDDSTVARGTGHLPATFGGLSIDAKNVIVTSLHRESVRSSAKLPEHFCNRVSHTRDPFVIRLVEYDGVECEVTLRLPGPVAGAARTNLLGEVLEVLEPFASTPPFGPAGLPWSAVRLRLAPREVATVMVDLELGRHAPLERATS